MTVPRLTEVQLVVLFCSSILVMLLDNQRSPECVKMLFLLSPHLCCIIGFICVLFPEIIHGRVRRPLHGPNKYIFNPYVRVRVGILKATSNSLKVALHCGTFHKLLCSVSLTNILIYSVMFG